MRECSFPFSRWLVEDLPKAYSPVDMELLNTVAKESQEKKVGVFLENMDKTLVLL